MKIQMSVRAVRAAVVTWARSVIDMRDLHLYGGLVILGYGLTLWRGSGPGLVAAGAVLLLIGVFGLPAWKKEKRHGSE